MYQTNLRKRNKLTSTTKCLLNVQNHTCAHWRTLRVHVCTGTRFTVSLFHLVISTQRPNVHPRSVFVSLFLSPVRLSLTLTVLYALYLRREPAANTGLSWLCGVLVEVLLLLDTGRPTVLQDAAAGHRHRTGSLGLVQQTEVSAAVQR